MALFFAFLLLALRALHIECFTRWIVNMEISRSRPFISYCIFLYDFFFFKRYVMECSIIMPILGLPMLQSAQKLTNIFKTYIY